MKKLLFLAVAGVLGSFGIANAQIQKGNLMLGADLGNSVAGSAGINTGLFGANFNLNKNAGWGIGINPKVGYFVKDNLLVGGIVTLGYNKAKGVDADHTTTYGIQALGRYYLSPGEHGIDNYLKHGRFFVEANAGFAGTNTSGSGGTTNGFAFGFGPGYSYFITPNVALEGLVKYNGLAGGGSAGYQNSLGINFGIQVFLPSSKVKSMIKDPSQL
ncbi:hypothetical protein A9P82_06870 [Arachidicoccus ginsenosidimutans]|uniref:hypothetical protein n=1 Tax=Arachidicoccus sp. BS20 TaxID=1850526 RepID=UPI0007F0FA3E|nr:hypothetical protein [Arachidicoccus sp. BS20]ANI90660.1 hypothetical protein A9P82_06870 [Arachidicoccus sp. BS20]